MTLSALGALEFGPIHVTFPSFVAIAQLLSDDMATLPFLITRSAELKLAKWPEALPLLFIAILAMGRLAHCTSLRMTSDALTIISTVKTPIAAMSRGTCE